MCYHIRRPPLPPPSDRLCSHTHLAPCLHHSSGGIVILGALGALTNDSNISPLFPAYREPPLLLLLRPLADSCILPHAAPPL